MIHSGFTGLKSAHEGLASEEGKNREAGRGDKQKC